MKTLAIRDAKTHLSRLVEEGARGEQVVITKAGKQMAKLVPISGLEKSRPLGLLAGRIRETRSVVEIRS